MTSESADHSSIRPLAATFVLLAAVLLIARLVIDRAPVRDWGIPALLLALGIGLLLWEHWASRPRPVTASPIRVGAQGDYEPPRLLVLERSADLTLPSERAELDEAAPIPDAPSAAPTAAEIVVVQPISEPPPVAAPRKAQRKDGTDDLTIIDGIGPKISAALIAAGIPSFAELARTPESRIREILEAAQLRIVGSVSASIPTWSYQAQLAADDRLSELEAWLAERKAGQA